MAAQADLQLQVSSHNSSANQGLRAEASASLTAQLAAVHELSLQGQNLLADSVTQQLSRLSTADLRRVVALTSKGSDSSISAVIKALQIIERQQPAENRFYSDSRQIKERSRAPAPHEAQTISKAEIIILPKQSKLEWDMRTHGLSKEQTLQMYKESGMDWKKILKAHTGHVASVNAFRKAFPKEQFFDTYRASPEAIAAAIKPFKLVVILGGDDHLKMINQAITDSFVAVVNSDSEFSVGALATSSAKTFLKSLKSLEKGQFRVQDWTRLDVTITSPTGVKTYRPALSEIVVAEEHFKYGSRGTSELDGNTLPFKGSGLIIATGVGSSGWFKSAARYVLPKACLWPRTSERIHTLQREPYGDLSTDFQAVTRLDSGKTLTITSGMNRKGVLSIDSIPDIQFHRGTKAELAVSKSPLKVIIPED